MEGVVSSPGGEPDFLDHLAVEKLPSYRVDCISRALGGFPVNGLLNGDVQFRPMFKSSVA